MPRLIARADLDQMVSMFNAGLRPDVLASAFGISERAVYFRLAKRGLHYPRPRTRKQQLAIEVRQGKVNQWCSRFSVVQMAAYLGVRPRTLRAWLAKHMPQLYDQMKANLRTRRAARPKAVRISAPPARPPGPLPLTRWRRAQVKRAYLAGDTLAVIARRYGHHTTTIWRLLRRQGVRLRERTAHLRQGNGEARREAGAG